jgi:hypothetical protein
MIPFSSRGPAALVVAFELGCTGNVPVASGSSADPITVCVEADGGLCGPDTSADASPGDSQTEDAAPL